MPTMNYFSYNCLIGSQIDYMKSADYKWTMIHGETKKGSRCNRSDSCDRRRHYLVFPSISYLPITMGGSGINTIETKQDQKKSQRKKKIAYFKGNDRQNLLKMS